MTEDASEPNHLLDAAIAYAQAGLPVFPLRAIRNGRCACGRPNCDSPGKHPSDVIQSGLKDATTDIKTIKDWWSARPDANIGIRTGKESGVIVVDVDGLAGEKALAEALGDLPETWHSTTGKGHHYYFKHPGFPVRNRTRLLPEVDIRGDGGYVVAPPSQHISGVTYSGIPFPFPPIAECSAALIRLIQQPITTAPIPLVGPAIREGQRNDHLYRLARKLKYAKACPEAILASLVEENRHNITVPLPDEEVEFIARHAFTQRDRADFRSDDLKLVSYSSILRYELPPVDWVIDDLIAARDRTVVYGEFGSFKSWLLLHLAIHIAAGQFWLGQFKIARPMSVLYVDEEMNQRTLRWRIKRLGMGAGLAHHDLPFKALSRAGITFDEDGAETLLDLLKDNDFDPDIIIVEALRRVIVGSESDAVDVGKFWRHVEPILRAGKTLIISHHMKKPGKADRSRDRASGSTDIIAGADSAFAINRTHGTPFIEMECVKSRECEEVPPFELEFLSESKTGPAALKFLGVAERTNAATATKADRTALDKLMDFLADQNREGTTSDILKHLKGLGIPPRTVQRALKLGRKLKVLLRPRRGLYRLAADEEAA